MTPSDTTILAIDVVHARSLHLTMRSAVLKRSSKKMIGLPSWPIAMAGHLPDAPELSTIVVVKAEQTIVLQCATFSESED